MAEHTPGPWERNWHSVNDGPRHWSIFIQDGEWTAYVLADRIESEADARLIAAAPDLLAALEFIATIADLGDLQNSHEVILLKARAAIAKATGKGS